MKKALYIVSIMLVLFMIGVLRNCHLKMDDDVRGSIRKSIVDELPSWYPAELLDLEITDRSCHKLKCEFTVALVAKVDFCERYSELGERGSLKLSEIYEHETGSPYNDSAYRKIPIELLDPDHYLFKQASILQANTPKDKKINLYKVTIPRGEIKELKGTAEVVNADGSLRVKLKLDGGSELKALKELFEQAIVYRSALYYNEISVFTAQHKIYEQSYRDLMSLYKKREELGYDTEAFEYNKKLLKDSSKGESQ